MPLPKSGISYSLSFDYANAAHYWDKDPVEFSNYRPSEQAYMVAFYRAKTQLEAVMAYKKAREDDKRKSSNRPIRKKR